MRSSNYSHRFGDFGYGDTSESRIHNLRQSLNRQFEEAMMTSEKYGKDPSKYYEYKREKKREKREQINQRETSFLRRFSNNSPKNYPFHHDRHVNDNDRKEETNKMRDYPSYLLSTRITLKSLLGKDKEAPSRSSSVKKDPTKEIRELADSMFKTRNSIHSAEKEVQPTTIKGKRNRVAQGRHTGAEAKKTLGDSANDKEFEQIISHRKERSSSVKRSQKANNDLQDENKITNNAEPLKKVVANKETNAVDSTTVQKKKVSKNAPKKSEQKQKRMIKEEVEISTKQRQNKTNKVSAIEKSTKRNNLVVKENDEIKAKGVKKGIVSMKDAPIIEETKKNGIHRKIDPLSTIVDDLTLGLSLSSDKVEDDRPDYDEMIMKLLQESKAIEERATGIENKEPKIKMKEVKNKKHVVINEEEGKPSGVDNKKKRVRPAVKENKNLEAPLEKKVTQKPKQQKAGEAKKPVEEKKTKKETSIKIEMKQKEEPNVNDSLDIHKPSVIPQNILDFISSMKETLNNDYNHEKNVKPTKEELHEKKPIKKEVQESKVVIKPEEQKPIVLTKEERQKYLEERKAADKKLLDELLLMDEEEDEEDEEEENFTESSFLELEKKIMNEQSSSPNFVFSSSTIDSLLIEGVADEDTQ